jgi:HEAT repeat protein
MRSEMHDLREMVSLSLMQQQSASERLKGVSWSGELERPSSAMVTALLDTLMHDPNVNVRLATIDALERFASQEEVRRGAIQAVDRQVSPLVQIALIDFMVKEHERESIGTLRRLSEDPQVDGAVRARAAWGLQQLG